MGFLGRRKQRRALEQIGAEVVRAELDAVIAQGAATAERWRAELAAVESKLAAVQAEFDGFPGNGLVSSEIADLEAMREQLQKERRRLRGMIWLMVKADHQPKSPPDEWQP